MDEKLKKKIGQWKIKADNDLKIAENELTRPDPVTDAICFHSQQAVEKYLKMFILANGIEPDKTHNISVLLNECSKYERQFLNLIEIDYLTEYAIAVRYIDDFYIPLIEEAQKAVEKARMVREFVNKKLAIL